MSPRLLAWLLRAMIWMASFGLLVLLVASGAATRLDHSLYDLHLKYWHYTPAGDVVIVAIDPKSLDALGRWPWQRTLHAQLIDRLHEAGVRGIGVDIVLSSDELVRPEDDVTLTQAVQRAGNVIMPVFAESVDLGGQLQETMPIPALAQSAQGLGHVDVARDDDGIVRGAYLRAGLGGPYWPSFALALYQQIAGPQTALPGLRDLYAQAPSPYVWFRDNFIMLRFAGPSGSFGRVSYVDVLRGDIAAPLLKDRWVMIGATAEGLGDMLPTPGLPMPGVEYQANVLESLQHGRLVTPLGLLPQLLIGAAVLFVPLLLFGLPGLRQGWRAIATGYLVALATSVGLLRFSQLWWPPAACLIILSVGLIGYALFAWRQRGPSRRRD